MHSAILVNSSVESIAVPSNHREMVKFDKITDDAFQSVAFAIKKLVKHAENKKREGSISFLKKSNDQLLTNLQRRNSVRVNLSRKIFNS